MANAFLAYSLYKVKRNNFHYVNIVLLSIYVYQAMQLEKYCKTPERIAIAENRQKVSTQRKKIRENVSEKFRKMSLADELLADLEDDEEDDFMGGQEVKEEEMEEMDIKPSK